MNLKGPFFLIQALLPLLANPASIVLNGSINAHIGMPNTSIYAATKAGLMSLAETLSGELLPRGVRANVVSPGPIATPFHEKIGMDEAAVKALVAQIPAGRAASRSRSPTRSFSWPRRKARSALEVKSSSTAA